MNENQRIANETKTALEDLLSKEDFQKCTVNPNFNGTVQVEVQCRAGDSLIEDIQYILRDEQLFAVRVTALFS